MSETEISQENTSSVKETKPIDYFNQEVDGLMVSMPEINQQRNKRYAFSILSSAVVCVALAHVLLTFFEFSLQIAVAVSTIVALALAVLEFDYIKATFSCETEPKKMFIMARLMVTLLLLFVGVFVAISHLAKDIDSQIGRQINTQKKALLQESPLYVSLRKQLAGLEKAAEATNQRRVALQKKLSELTDKRQAWSQLAECENAGEKICTHPDTRRNVASGKSASRFSAANKKYNSYMATLKSFDQPIKLTKDQLGALPSDKDIKDQIEYLRHQLKIQDTAATQSATAFNDGASNKLTAVVRLITEGERRFEAIFTLVFIMLITIFVDFVQLLLLFNEPSCVKASRLIASAQQRLFTASIIQSFENATHRHQETSVITEIEVIERTKPNQPILEVVNV